MKSFLDNFAAVLGAATVALLLLSLTHEYGYFSIMGRHYQTLLTTTDYLANTIVWLPAVVIVVITAEWERLTKTPSKRDFRKWRTWAWLAFMSLFVAWILGSMKWPPNSLSMYLLITFILVFWARFWRRFDYSNKVGEDWRPFVGALIRIGPPLLFTIYVFGAINATDDLEDTTDPYFVQFKNAQAMDVKSFLRSFDKGVLLKDRTTNFIEFHKWDDIVRIERVAASRKDSLLCYFLDWGCKRESALPPLP